MNNQRYVDYQRRARKFLATARDRAEATQMLRTVMVLDGYAESVAAYLAVEIMDRVSPQ
jgi:hypothetical protein